MVLVMGKLYRRAGSPYLWARWYDADGQLHRESTKSADRRVAQRFLSVREAQAINERAGLAPKSIALADAVAEYLDAHAPPIWSAKWHRVVSLWFRATIIPDVGGGADKRVADVGRDRVEAARERWLASGLVPPTVNRLCACGSGFFKWALRRGYASGNPFAGHKRFAEVKRTPPPVTEADLARFVAAIPNPVIRRAAVVLLDTGLRDSEIRRVRASDIVGRELHVASSYERGLTKNRRERWGLLTARAKAAIEEQGSFSSLPVNVRKSLHRAQREAGLERFRWHDLRHYALTRAARAGVLPHDLRGMAGWAGDESARYIHPSAAGMEAFVSSVDRVPWLCQKPGRRVRKAAKNGTPA